MSAQLVAVVDDDASFRAALEDLLAFAGFDVRTYGTGEALLDSGEIDCFDGFLLDVQMPGMSGLELIAQMRGAGVEAPVLFVTSRTDERVRREASASKAAAVFGKPFDPDLLLETLRRELA